MLTVVHFSLLVASFHFLMTSTLLFCYKLDTTLVAISCLCYYWAHPLAASWPLRAARTESFAQVAAQFAFGRRRRQFPRLGVLWPINARTPFWRALQSFELKVIIQLVRSPVSMKSESDFNLPNLINQSSN